MRVTYNIILLSFLIHGHEFDSVQLSKSTKCLDDSPFKLSPYDGLLGGRLKVKDVLVRNGSSMEEFISRMGNFKSNGTEYTSKGTSDWLSETIQGLSGSYDEIKNLLRSSAAAGYKDVTNNLKDHFKKNLGNNRHLYFKMRMRGIFEYDWIIEQLSDQKGYRVYQSIGDAYSLKAWLTRDPMDFWSGRLWNNGHIKYWQKNYNRIQHKLRQIQNIVSKELQPWLTFIKEYNKTLITHNMRRAWVNFGGGRNINVETFQNQYLGRLHNITAQLKQVYFKHSRTEWTKRMDDMWIELFGSPNIYCYPGLSFDTDTLLLPQTIKIETKILQSSSEKETSKNVQVLAESVSHNKNELGYCSKSHTTQANAAMMLFGMMASLW